MKKSKNEIMTDIHAKGFGLILLTFLIFAAAFGQEKSRIAFTINEPNLIPEGIAYDAPTKTFYVG